MQSQLLEKLRQEDYLFLGLQDQPGQHIKTLNQTIKTAQDKTRKGWEFSMVLV